MDFGCFWSNTIIPTKKSVTLIDPDTSPNPVIEAVDFGKVNQGLLEVLVEVGCG